MRKLPLLFLAFSFLAACGDDMKPDPRDIQLTIAEPSALEVLKSEDRVVTIALHTVVNGKKGTEVAKVTLEPTADKKDYTGRFSEIVPGTYWMRLLLIEPWKTSSITVSLKTNQEAETATLDVPVAVFEKQIEIIKGQEKIIMDCVPSDFAFTEDDDNDGITNFDEITKKMTHPQKADTDGDGTPDNIDIFPSLSTEFGDKDGDGIGDNIDNCYDTANADQLNTDGDGEGDACDPDQDGDGLTNDQEKNLGSKPLIADTDEDGILDGKDNCLLIANKDQADFDKDGLGDECDTDDDNDKVLDSNDNCPFYSASTDQTNSDTDGMGDVCDTDDDNDGVKDTTDNCPLVANADQTNSDTDTAGDACDNDDDGDGVLDVAEIGPGPNNYVTSSTLADTDGDGISDKNDLCPITPLDRTKFPLATNHTDTDGDGEGDECDCLSGDATIKSSNAVFVDAQATNSQELGARNHPVKTIQRGIALAKATAKKLVYVSAGTYMENIVMDDGISVVGGFKLSDDGKSCERSLYKTGAEANEVLITSSSGPTVLFNDITQETRLEGVKVQNKSTVGLNLVEITSQTSSSQNLVIIRDSYLMAPNIDSGDVVAVLVSKASPLFLNNIIDAGNSSRTTAIQLQDSPKPIFLHNTIRGGGSIIESIVVDSTNSVPIFLNNILFTEKGINQSILSFNDSSPSTSIVIKNNLLFGVKNTDENSPVLYSTGAFSPSIRLTTVADVNDKETSFDKNITLTKTGNDYSVTGDILPITAICPGAATRNYRLKDNTVIVNGKGLSKTNIEIAISNSTLLKDTFKDRDGTGRNLANPDIGAFEKI